MCIHAISGFESCAVVVETPVMCSVCNMQPGWLWPGGVQGPPQSIQGQHRPAFDRRSNTPPCPAAAPCKRRFIGIAREPREPTFVVRCIYDETGGSVEAPCDDFLLTGPAKESTGGPRKNSGAGHRLPRHITSPIVQHKYAHELRNRGRELSTSALSLASPLRPFPPAISSSCTSSAHIKAVQPS